MRRIERMLGQLQHGNDWQKRNDEQHGSDN
jgi:hypothetical protein